MVNRAWFLQCTMLYRDIIDIVMLVDKLNIVLYRDIIDIGMLVDKLNIVLILLVLTRCRPLYVLLILFTSLISTQHHNCIVRFASCSHQLLWQNHFFSLQLYTISKTWARNDDHNSHYIVYIYIVDISQNID